MKNVTLIGATLLSTVIVSGCAQKNISISGEIRSANTEISLGLLQEDVNLELSGDIHLLKDNRYIVTSTTDTGAYSYQQLPSGQYKVTPSLTGYHFKPESRSFLAKNQDIKGLNFLSYQHQLWFQDDDADGFGDTHAILDSDTQPDGYVLNDTDCDDFENTTFPGAVDAPDDGIDQNCDGKLAATWFKDGDQDTYGDNTNFVVAEEKPSELYVLQNGDCNDAEKNIHPTAIEVPYDLIDQDCNNSDAGRWYQDTDSDGYGDTAKLLIASTAPADYVAIAGDCNDQDSAINPAAIEITADHIDQNCDGSDKRRWYFDEDLDGFGIANGFIEAELQPTNYAAYSTDCDDHDNSINPGAQEITGDAIDQNCDGKLSVSWFADDDNDGWGDATTEIEANDQPALGFIRVSRDCSDSNPNIHPGATEVVGDGIDQDCDGADQLSWYQDSDKDGYGNLNVYLVSVSKPFGYVADHGDCNDLNKAIHPGVLEITADSIDQDCDGSDSWKWYLDQDQDGFGKLSSTKEAPTKPVGYVANALDCDDDSAIKNPLVEEIAEDGIDQNCNGFDKVRWYQDVDGDHYGEPTMSWLYDGLLQPNYSTNNHDCDDYNASVYPGAAELNNGLDNDCDGLIGE